MFGSLFGKKRPEDIQNAAGLEIVGIVSIAPKTSGIETFDIAKSFLEQSRFHADGTLTQNNPSLIKLRQWSKDTQMSFRQVTTRTGDTFIPDGNKHRLSLWVPRSSGNPPHIQDMIVFSEEWTGSEFSPREWRCGSAPRAQFAMAVIVPTCCQSTTVAPEQNVLLTYYKDNERQSIVRQSPKALVKGIGNYFKSAVRFTVADSPRKEKEFEGIARQFGL